jgi:hypothetical protein
MKKYEIKNICTNKKIIVSSGVLFEKIEKCFDKQLEYFFQDNFKDINYLVSNNIFSKLELNCNNLEFKISDNLMIEYDIRNLISNIANNCCDGINVEFNNNNLQITNLYLYDKIVNSSYFKYFEVLLYNKFEEINYKIANTLNNLECEQEYISFDEKNDIYEVIVCDVI